MDLEKFVYHFGFKVVRVNEGGYKQIDSWSAYNSPSYYRDIDDSIIEMEIDRRRLEYMANYFEQCQRLDHEEHEEHRLRQQNPALKEAYDKYKMLLELYK
jgi:hypothetical protein